MKPPDNQYSYKFSLISAQNKDALTHESEWFQLSHQFKHLKAPQSLQPSTEHVVLTLSMLLCCKRFVYNPKLSNTQSPIILPWMYTSLTHLKNNFIANLLNAHLLGTTLITSSSVVSLNSHKTSFIMTLFLSLFDR